MLKRAIDPEDEAQRRWAMRGLLWVFLFVAGLAACVTIVFLTMRQVMAIGGACATGGAYVSARACPQAIWLMPIAIVAGLACIGLYLFRRPPGTGNIALLAWPALFLSLGWNFFEYGLWPPGGQGLAWGWLVCAFVFALMGGGPLIVAASGGVGPFFRRHFWDDEPPAPPPPPPPARAPLPSWTKDLPPRKTSASASPPSAAVPRPETPAPAGDTAPDLVAQLERLDTLHRSGSLTTAEFEAAKQRLLAGGRG